MIRHLRPFVSLALGALLVAGCDRSILSPGEVAGTYVLERVNASPLPAVITDTEFTTVTLLADTLRLNDDSTGSEVRVQHYVAHPNGTTPTRETLSLFVRYEPRHGGIRLGYACSIDGNSLCLSVVPVEITAELTSTGLVMHIESNDWHFRRIG